MKNILKGSFLAVTLLTISSTLSLAVEETPLSELSPEVKAAEIQNLDQQENERKKAFEEQLGFSVPAYTDNPSYVITFRDPSPQKSGVQLEIDNDKFVEIKSPYALPALSIGQHHLSFKFTDKDGAVQELEYSLSVLPRAPIFKTPTYDNDSIFLSGSGLANSEILLFLTSGTNSYPKLVNVNADGTWEVKIQPKNGASAGIYTVVGYTRKYGYASDLSEPTVFEVGASTTQILEGESNSNIFFSFSSITKDNIKDVLFNNSDLLILLGSMLALGAIVALLINHFVSDQKDNFVLKSVEKSIKKVGATEEKTLREVFEAQSPKGADKKEIIVEQQQEKKTEKVVAPANETQKEKVITKEEFLRKFKMIDPDDNKGKEHPATPKREVKISLTSHQEE